MKNNFNEKGYALLIVLLTITIIFTVSSVLISGSISSAKQINFTDEFTRSVDLAEMGSTVAKASFYKTADDIKADTNFITSDMLEEVDTDGDGSKEKIVNTTKFLNKVQSELDDSLVLVKNSDLNNDGSLDTGDNYTLEAVSTIDSKDSKITYNIKSNGLAGETNHLIEFNIVVMTTPPGESSTGTVEIFDDTDDFNKAGSGLSDTWSASSIYENNKSNYTLTNSDSTLVVDDSVAFSNGLKIDSSLSDITFNKPVAVNGSPGPVFGESGSSSRDKVTINNSFYATPGPTFINADVIINGFSSTQGLYFDSSNATINNNIDIFNSPLDLKNNAKVEINGSVKTSSNLNVGNGSELIIHGNAFLPDNINVSDSGIVIIYGKMSGNNNHMNNNKTKYKLISSPDQAELGKINYFDREVTSSGGGSADSSDMQFDIDQKDVTYN